MFNEQQLDFLIALLDRVEFDDAATSALADECFAALLDDYEIETGCLHPLDLEDGFDA